ncbi:MAG: VWA domain-containing protein [Pyrinomonadaceae bacterium]|nr:VWA domain-containing protein [Pyrinomonadaceae bacterium]MBP9110055.1 VWA domain-containing protein [Pyrinomonadaceae bacterium]
MKKIYFFLVIHGLFAVGALAQVPTPTGRPTPPDTDVVKISTNLIQLDVTVTDSKGKVVTDLRADEIEVYENGEKQKITGLTFVSSKRSVEKTKTPDVVGVPIPQSGLRPENIRRTIGLVVDDLSLSFESAYQTRRALKKFVDEQMDDGDLVAIIRTGAGIGALQQFTSDKRILYAAIEKVKWNPQGSGGISAFAPIEQTVLPADAEEADPDQPAERDPARALDDFRTTVFATGTLGALRYIVQGMSELPGRKSVILFSDGFKLFEEDESGFRESGQVLDFLRILVDTANRSSVVFYTVDPRGLAYTGFTAADSPSINPTAMNQALSARSAQLTDTQDGLSYLAGETGGFDIKNSNDLTGGVRKILDDQSYYLVAYEPDGDTFDPAKRKFNDIDIKILRKDAKARYRSGFFNVADRPVQNGISATTAVGQLELALVSPFAVSGINLRLNALFGSDAKNPAYVRSLLHVDAKDLKFTDAPNGSKAATIEVLAMSFGDNGQPIDQLAKGYTLTLKPEAYKKIITDGFIYHFLFPVKKPGAYQYRVAIRDSVGGRVGSASQFIEVPDLKKKRLTASSIVLENLSPDQWRRAGEQNSPLPIGSNPMSDTALRRVKQNSVLRYGFEIYNAVLDTSKRPQLTMRVRVFRDGKLVLDGTPNPVSIDGQTDLQRIRSSRAIAIGAQMEAGDYILQVIITDPLAKKNQQVATQFVQFEIVQ